jgi:hypothetical protein
MKSVSKAFIGSLVLGATALTSTTPAMARDRDRGIDGEDILAGALVLGGIAAIAAIASDGDRDDRRYDSRYDRRYDDQRYDDRRYDDRYGDRRNRDYRYNGASSQDAVQQCIYAAETTAARYNYGTRAEVYDIRDVDRNGRRFEVRGRIAVQERGRNYRRDRWDEGNFTCEVRRGRVVDLDYSGIRGL